MRMRWNDCRGRAWAGLIHAALLVAALAVLPILPSDSWKPTDSSQPQWRIVMLLAANVGLPYFLLSASAPLVQAWYSRVFQGHVPYRLYALSNVGSLTALLSYPFLFEPKFDISHQSTLWSLGFGAYAVLSWRHGPGDGSLEPAGRTHHVRRGEPRPRPIP